jgi:hypothetical protein
MVGMEDNGNTIGGSNGTDVVGCSNCTRDGGLLVCVGNTLRVRGEFKSVQVNSDSHHLPYRQSRQHLLEILEG